MDKYRIEYKDIGKWSLYSDYGSFELENFKEDCIRLVKSGKTIRSYQVN